MNHIFNKTNVEVSGEMVDFVKQDVIKNDINYQSGPRNESFEDSIRSFVSHKKQIIPKLRLERHPLSCYQFVLVVEIWHVNVFLIIF